MKDSTHPLLVWKDMNFHVNKHKSGTYISQMCGVARSTRFQLKTDCFGENVTSCQASLSKARLDFEDPLTRRKLWKKNKGKMYLLFLLTLVQHPCLAHALTLLKGNLLFEEIGGHQLNQEYMTFSRKVDSSDLQNFAQTLKALAELYEYFCQQVKGLSSSLQHKKASKPEPFLHFHGTKLFYSVPTNTTIYINCPNLTIKPIFAAEQNNDPAH